MRVALTCARAAPARPGSCAAPWKYYRSALWPACAPTAAESHLTAAAARRQTPIAPRTPTALTARLAVAGAASKPARQTRAASMPFANLSTTLHVARVLRNTQEIQEQSVA